MGSLTLFLSAVDFTLSRSTRAGNYSGMQFAPHHSKHGSLRCSTPPNQLGLGIGGISAGFNTSPTVLGWLCTLHSLFGGTHKKPINPFA